MSQAPSSNVRDTTSRTNSRGQSQQYINTAESSIPPHEVIQEHAHSNTSPQTPAKHRRQKPQQSPHDRQPHGKQTPSTTKKRSGLRNVSQSGDELAAPGIHNMDGAGYHSADATSVMNHTTTPARQAYAGPTFHASPAASTLPIPKNFAKSLPADTPKSRLQAQVDRDTADEDTRFRSPPPSASHLFPPRSEQDSPIDFLLNAHRAQQGKSRDDSLGNGRPVSWNEDAVSRRPDSNSSTPRPRGPGTPGSMSNKEMFMMEVDGASEELEADDSPNVVPFGQRMSDLRTNTGPHTDRARAEAEEEQRLAKSKALKTLLFTGSEQLPQASSHPEVPCHPPHPSQSPFYTPNDPFEQTRPGSERANNNVSFVPEYGPQAHSNSHNRFQSGSQAGQKYRGAPPSPPNRAEQMNRYSQQHGWDDYANHRRSIPPPHPQQGVYFSPVADPGTGPAWDVSAHQAQATRSNHDVTAMEDSLRRMLKLEDRDRKSGP